MDSDIEQLKEKISKQPFSTTEKVDGMNRLCSLLFENNVADAYEVSLEALHAAEEIDYINGKSVALTHIAMALSSQREYAEAREYFRQALTIKIETKDKDGEAAIYSKMGNTYLYEGKYLDALTQYEQASLIRTDLNDESGLADLLTNSAIVHGLQGHHSKALEAHLKALRIYEKNNQNSRIAASTSNIGVIYLEQKNYESALKMFQRALAIREENNDLRDIGIQLNNIGYAYQELNHLDLALNFHLRALALREQLGDEAKIATTFSNLGNVYKLKGEKQLSFDYYSKALQIFEQLKEKRGMIQSYTNLGEHFYEEDNTERAHYFLNKSIVLAEELGLRNQLSVALHISSKTLAKEKRYAEAYDMLCRYMALDKEISNTETTMRMAQMSSSHEIEKKEREAEFERLKNVELTKAYNLLEAAKQRSEELLLNILPEEVSAELKESGKTKARSYDSATVLFADIKEFTKISEQFSAEEIVSGIDEYFDEFDRLMDKHGIEKIKTIGDAYLCVCGVPVPADNHAKKMIELAKDLIRTVFDLKEKRGSENKHTFDFRIGIHSGPIVAGVVGSKKFAYDIWGDTVNTASRMQSNSMPNRINISESTYNLVKNDYECEYRGEIEAKNKGKLKMYFVN